MLTGCKTCIKYEIVSEMHSTNNRFISFLYWIVQIDYSLLSLSIFSEHWSHTSLIVVKSQTDIAKSCYTSSSFPSGTYLLSIGRSSRRSHLFSLSLSPSLFVSLSVSLFTLFLLPVLRHHRGSVIRGKYMSGILYALPPEKINSARHRPCVIDIMYAIRLKK